MIPGLNPTKAMLSLLAKYPDVTTDICDLINRQQREAKVIAEAVNGEPFPAALVTPDDLKATIEESGPTGLLAYFEVFHENNVKILQRVIADVPGAQERVAAKKAAQDQATAAKAAEAEAAATPVLNCPGCKQPLAIEQPGEGPCPMCQATISVTTTPGEDGNVQLAIHLVPAVVDATPFDATPTDTSEE